MAITSRKCDANKDILTTIKILHWEIVKESNVKDDLLKL